MAQTIPIRVQVAGLTDVGLMRDHNEDNFALIDLDRHSRDTVERARTIELGERGVLLLVCDGMGGAAAGEVASSMAVEAIFQQLATDGAGSSADEAGLEAYARRLRSAVYAANRQILDASQKDEARAGMGTTLTAVAAIDGHLITVQVGDSRAYLLRRGRVVQVTRDQSLVNQLLETGQITAEQAALFEHSNVILQALGVQPEVEVQLGRMPLRLGDVVLVCSDGLTGVLSDAELGEILGSTADLDEACRTLIRRACDGGGPDNITAMVARFEGDGLERPGEQDEPRYERWNIDAEREKLETPAGAQEGEASPSQAPLELEPTRPRAHLPARAEQSMAFLSTMILVAVALGAAIFSSIIFRHVPSVLCAVSAGAPGWAIRVDGRHTGAKTLEGAAAVRLPLGPHRVELHGPDAPSLSRDIDARAASDECRADFASQ